MPIDTPHREYSSRAMQWQRVRDCIEGEDAVKDRGTDYLPKLGGQDEIQYAAYLARALFYNTTERVLSGLNGAIHRKDADVEWPEDRLGELETITPDGKDIQVLAQDVSREALSVSRYGILVDMPPEGGEPFLCLYRAEDIVNWRTEIVAGKQELVLAVLRETYEEIEDDPYKPKLKTQYRELLIEEGRYTQRLWRKNDKEWSIFDEIVPARTGRPLDFIPLVIGGARGLGVTPEKPALYDLAAVNLSHYRNSADLEHGQHWTALPTPVVTNVEGDTTFQIGPENVWMLGEGGTAFMLEFTGAGLQAIRDGMEAKERHMAVLGSRLLEGQKKGVEATETVELRSAGEQASLASVARTVSEAITMALRWYMEWIGGPEAHIDLNRDFVSVEMSPQELTALVGALNSGAISLETFLWNLKRGERLDVSEEDEMERIDSRSMV